MIRIILFFFFPLCFYGQMHLSKQDETKLYTQAITEYIKSVNEIDKLTFDTLFVGPVDPEYIQNVELPKEILKTKIAKLTEEEGQRKVEYHKNFVFANVIAISKEHAEFIFVTFIVEKSPTKTDWWPKHNYVVNFNYDPKTKVYLFDKQRFEYKYSNKYTKKE